MLTGPKNATSASLISNYFNSLKDNMIEIILALVFLFALGLAMFYYERIACKHKWVHVERVDVYGSTDMSMPIHVKHILKCEKCGNLKKKTF